MKKCKIENQEQYIFLEKVYYLNELALQDTEEDIKLMTPFYRKIHMLKNFLSLLHDDNIKYHATVDGQINMIDDHTLEKYQ